MIPESAEEIHHLAIKIIIWFPQVLELD